MRLSRKKTSRRTVDDRNLAWPCIYHATIIPRVLVSEVLQDLCHQPQDLIRLNMLFGPYGRSFGGKDYLASVRRTSSGSGMGLHILGPCMKDPVVLSPFGCSTN